MGWLYWTATRPMIIHIIVTLSSAEPSCMHERQTCLLGQTSLRVFGGWTLVERLVMWLCLGSHDRPWRWYTFPTVTMWIGVDFRFLWVCACRMYNRIYWFGHLHSLMKCFSRPIVHYEHYHHQKALGIPAWVTNGIPKFCQTRIILSELKVATHNAWITNLL